MKPRSGGLLLLRRITRSPRRDAVYFCSGVYIFYAGGKFILSQKCTSRPADVVIVVSDPDSSSQFSTGRMTLDSPLQRPVLLRIVLALVQSDMLAQCVPNHHSSDED